WNAYRRQLRRKRPTQSQVPFARDPSKLFSSHQNKIVQAFSAHKTDRSIALTEVRPVNAIALSNSVRKISIAWRTPSAPATPNPYKYGRPIKTAAAPFAIAFNTSPPR